MKIRLCQHNKGADKLADQLLAQYPDLDIKLKKCVKQCKKCKQKPLVMVDKQPFTAADKDELYGLLLALICQKKIS